MVEVRESSQLDMVPTTIPLIDMGEREGEDGNTGGIYTCRPILYYCFIHFSQT